MGRVSVACSNSGMRVSCHSAFPARKGEFAAIATCTPAMACAAFQCAAKSSGATRRCSCSDVHAASGRIVSEVMSRRSPTTAPGSGAPSMSISMSSPRAAKTCSLSRS